MKKSRVFISYAHESEAHNERVFELSERLRSEGVDCYIDQYEVSPPDGWPRWSRNQIRQADFVLVACALRLMEGASKDRNQEEPEQVLSGRERLLPRNSTIPKEVEGGEVAPRSFTISNMAKRIEIVGDLWSDLLKDETITAAVRSSGWERCCCGELQSTLRACFN
jgi:hypothetical protein